MKQVNASIITIGDELLIGQTIDTNSAWIGQQLNRLGIWVRHRVAVGDTREAILEALHQESPRADIILVTGGLGPTGDDITKGVLCEYFGARLVEDPRVLAHVNTMFLSRGLPVLLRNRQQALVPDACTVLFNSRGTAPGMWFEKEGKICVSMPGVPHEMQGIMTDHVLPRLGKYFQLPVILHRTLVTMGMGESQVAERLVAYEQSLPENVRLAYLPGNGLLKLRVTTRGELQERAAAESDRYFTVLKETLADIAVADDDVLPEEWTGRLLKENNLTLATAESCTGGLIARKVTSVPGSSGYFKGSVVSYANEVKQNVLKVPEAVLQTYGAVSEETVRAMAAGALALIKADLAVAVSGIMGPGGGMPGKPVGTVWIAAGTKDCLTAKKYQLRYTRGRNMEITANYALNMLREAVLNHTRQR